MCISNAGKTNDSRKNGIKLLQREKKTLWSTSATRVDVKMTWILKNGEKLSEDGGQK